MDSYTLGYFVPIVIVLIVAIWMMATGFSKENMEKVDRINQDHLAGAVAKGIQLHEQGQRPPIASKECAECGTRNRAKAKFCSECGVELAGS